MASPKPPLELPPSGATPSRISLPGCDAAGLRRKLSARRPSLFSKERDDAEVWVADDVGGVKKQPLLTWRLPAEDGSTSATDPAWDVLYVIRQSHSWDRLRILSQTFDNLTAALRVFPYFTTSVLNFGVKIQDDNNTWHAFHSRPRPTGTGRETCYMLYFFENNGKTDGDPWTPRQTAVYHSFDASRGGQSSWILIKPSPVVEESLELELAKMRLFNVPRVSRAVCLHLLFLSFTMRNWPDYLAAQTAALQRLETKSLYSEADHEAEHDYELTFEDRQRTQVLTHKLMRAAAILDAMMDLQTRVRDALLCMSGDDDGLNEAVVIELADLAAQAKYYRRYVDDLQRRASDTMALLLDILNRRYGRASLRSAEANESSLKANVTLLERMTSIASNAEMERELEQRTAANLRALTVVATLYLPASLLAGIFSSNLVQTDSAGSFFVSPEFWKFVVVLVPMVLVTFAVVIVLQTVWRVRQQGTLRKMSLAQPARGDTGLGIADKV